MKNLVSNFGKRTSARLRHCLCGPVVRLGAFCVAMKVRVVWGKLLRSSDLRQTRSNNDRVVRCQWNGGHSL